MILKPFNDRAQWFVSFSYDKNHSSTHMPQKIVHTCVEYMYASSLWLRKFNWRSKLSLPWDRWSNAHHGNSIIPPLLSNEGKLAVANEGGGVTERKLRSTKGSYITCRSEDLFVEAGQLIFTNASVGQMETNIAKRSFIHGTLFSVLITDQRKLG